MRATLRLSSPAWFAHPKKTSSTAAGSTAGLRRSNCSITYAPRSSGRTPESAPRNFPTGVRTASMITASIFDYHPFMHLREGDPAPDFTLNGVPPGAYHLADQRGKVVVLAFYPGDFTPVCLRQLQHYEAQRERLVSTGATLWAISTDDLELHERMAKSYALSFPLLADLQGKVAALYGVRGLLGTARRSVFIVDPQGIIRYSKEEPLSLSYRSVDDILNALRDSGLLPAGQ
jgi:peroxiredoxin Q/BCP